VWKDGGSGGEGCGETADRDQAGRDEARASAASHRPETNRRCSEYATRCPSSARLDQVSRHRDSWNRLLRTAA